jgi:hypothetical protein
MFFRNGRTYYPTRCNSPEEYNLIKTCRENLKTILTSSAGTGNFISVLLHQWVLVTTAWRVLRLRREKRPPIRSVAANIMDKSPTADKEWFSSVGVGRGANNFSP